MRFAPNMISLDYNVFTCPLLEPHLSGDLSRLNEYMNIRL